MQNIQSITLVKFSNFTVTKKRIWVAFWSLLDRFSAAFRSLFGRFSVAFRSLFGRFLVAYQSLLGRIQVLFGSFRGDFQRIFRFCLSVIFPKTVQLKQSFCFRKHFPNAEQSCVYACYKASLVHPLLTFAPFTKISPSAPPACFLVCFDFLEKQVTLFFKSSITKNQNVRIHIV